MVTGRNISVAASIILAGSLVFSGCNGGSGTSPASSSSSNTESTQQQTSTTAEAISSSADEVSEVTADGIIRGKITLDETPVTTRSLQSSAGVQFNVTAYNLSDDSQYKTVTDSEGNYELRNLTYGEYQIIASNSNYAKQKIQQVTLRRDTQATVDVTLTAAGSIKGQVNLEGTYFGEGTTVIIPGTSYIATLDENGMFEMSGVPVGDYTLKINSIGLYNVSVKAGVNNIGEVSIKNMANYSNGTLNATLGMLHNGVSFGLNNYATKEDIESSVVLTDAEGNSVDFDINFDNGYTTTDAMGNTYLGYSSFNVVSQELLSKGDYVLTLKSDLLGLLNPVVVDLQLSDYAAAFAAVENYSGIPQKQIGLNFPHDTNLTTSMVTVTDAGGTEYNVTQLHREDAKSWVLIGDYPSEKALTVAVNGASIDGIIYPIDNSDANSSTLMFYKPDGYLAIDGKTEVQNGASIGIDFENTMALDSGTITITLTDETGESMAYSDENISLYNKYYYGYYNGHYLYYSSYYESYGYYDDSGNWVEIDEDDMNGVSAAYIREPSLEYNMDYNVTVSYNDVFGQAYTYSGAFSTIDPKFISFGESDMVDPLPQIHFEGLEAVLEPYVAQFNVPVNPESGSVTITDDEGNEVPVEVMIDDNNSHVLQFMPEEMLEPEMLYTVSIDGYTSGENNYSIDSVSAKFKTPAKMFTYSEVRNNQLLTTEDNVNNTLKFAFWGDFNDTQRMQIEDGFTIKSYHKDLSVDESHPEPKLTWQAVENYGWALFVSFTMDSDKVYEVGLNRSNAVEGAIVPQQWLSFATEQMNQNQDYDWSLSGVDYASLSGGLDMQSEGNSSDMTVTLVEKLESQLRIPLKVFENVGNLSDNERWELCNDTAKPAESDIEAMVTLTKDGQEIAFDHFEVEFSSVSTYTNYLDDRVDLMCYIYNASVSADVAADYNATYEATISVTTDIPKVYFYNNDVTHQDKMAPLGTIHYDASASESGLQVMLYTQTPMRVEDVESELQFTFDENLTLLSLSPMNSFYIDGVEYTDSVDLDFQSSQYSVLAWDASTKDNVGIELYDASSGQVAATKALTQTQSGLFEVVPDFTPITVFTADSESVDNDTVVITFSNAVTKDDLGTFTEDGNITEANFSVKDSDGNALTLKSASFDTIYWENNVSAVKAMKLLLASSMSFGQEYTFELNEGVVVTSPATKMTLKAPSVTPIKLSGFTHSELRFIRYYSFDLSSQDVLDVNTSVQDIVYTQYTGINELVIYAKTSPGLTLNDNPITTSDDFNATETNTTTGLITRVSLNSLSYVTASVNLEALDENDDIVESYSASNLGLYHRSLPYLFSAYVDLATLDNTIDFIIYENGCGWSTFNSDNISVYFGSTLIENGVTAAECVSSSVCSATLSTTLDANTEYTMVLHGMEACDDIETEITDNYINGMFNFINQ